MTNLSVNINKVATIRNARGGNVPDVEKVALDCERFGATASPYTRVQTSATSAVPTCCSCAPSCTRNSTLKATPPSSFMDLVLSVRPAQVTLVPDAPTL